MGESERRVALVLAYDGAPYAGWQIQPDRPTVQSEVESALGGLVGVPVRVCGSGRTDAGVHALGQVAHADIPERLRDEAVLGALNARLPDAVRVRTARTVPAGFHALHSAARKTYVYQLHLSDVAGGEGAVRRSLPPHRRHTFHAVRADLDLGAMRAGAARLVGRHDFTALSKAMPEGRATVKRVTAVRVLRVPRGLRLVVSGEGFLYGMVRLMGSLLVEIGRGRRDPTEVPELLEAADRSAAPASLPAHGLFLWRVDYPRDLFGPLSGADGLGARLLG